MGARSCGGSSRQPGRRSECSVEDERVRFLTRPLSNRTHGELPQSGGRVRRPSRTRRVRECHLAPAQTVQPVHAQTPGLGFQMVGQAQARWAAKERSAPRDAPSSYACDPSQTLLESDGGPLRLLGSQHRGNPGGNPVSVHHSCPGNPVSVHHSCPWKSGVSSSFLPVEIRCPAAHNAVGLAGESPAVGIDCLST